MRALSKGERKRLDRAVLQEASFIYDDRLQINTIHWDRPSRFSNLVAKNLIISPRGADDLIRELLIEEVESLVVASIRRLRRKKKIRINYVMVPVLSSGGRRGYRPRKMACYWPSTILEELARLG